MKRGSFWPCARAHWIAGGTRFFEYDPPAWLYVECQYGFIEDPTDPLTITTFHVGPAVFQWQYSKPQFAIEWVCPWTDGLADGQILFKQHPILNDAQCHGTIVHEFNYHGAVPFGDLVTYEFNQFGSWTEFGDFGANFERFDIRLSRLVTIWTFRVTGGQYQVVESFGKDSHDTAPLSW